MPGATSPIAPASRGFVQSGFYEAPTRSADPATPAGGVVAHVVFLPCRVLVALQRSSFFVSYVPQRPVLYSSEERFSSASMSRAPQRSSQVPYDLEFVLPLHAGFVPVPARHAVAVCVPSAEGFVAQKPATGSPGAGSIGEKDGPRTRPVKSMRSPQVSGRTTNARGLLADFATRAGSVVPQIVLLVRRRIWARPTCRPDWRRTASTAPDCTHPK